jgi:enoyl-[acyl-carrier protein] reductase/trans-2-enoyl-CoA reductase (NAD+)
VIKPIGATFTDKTVNFHTGVVSEVSIDPATEEEIRQTVEVMGGEDWMMWMESLRDAGVLANGALTVAYSYIGPDLTRAVYRDGTIGRAKDHLESTAHDIDAMLSSLGGHAYVSVNKAVVTQSSSAIPVVPLYISLLFKVMKEQGTHEDCTPQMVRLFANRLYTKDGIVPVDSGRRIRLDDLEMKPDVQDSIESAWKRVSSEDLKSLSDIEGYRSDFLQLFGFGLSGVDYDEDVEVDVHL